jgi:hypothetical protein
MYQRALHNFLLLRTAGMPNEMGWPGIRPPQGMKMGVRGLTAQDVSSQQREKAADLGNGALLGP